MSSYSSLDAVSAAVFATLNVSSLLALAPGGVGDVIEQGIGFPRVLYVVSERVLGGFGAGNRAGGGQRTLECNLRIHVFSTYTGMAEAQQVMAKCIELLATAPAVTGYGSWALFHDETIPLSGEVVGGVVVNELVANMRFYVSEAA